MQHEPNPKFRLVLLALGGLVGLLLAMQGLLEPAEPANVRLPANAVARVNGQHISRERFAALASDLAADSKAPLDKTDYEFVLDRLIDEELLIDRGIELGLAEQDPTVRKSIAAAVISQIATEAAADVPTEAELLAFYRAEPEFFTRNPRYRVHWWRIPGAKPAAAETAAELIEHLSATSNQNPKEAALPPRESMLPDLPLPAAKLSDYLGPQLLQAVQKATPGEWIGPLQAGDDWHVLQLVDLQAGRLPEFDLIRTEVEAEYRRRQGEQGLLDYLEWLRSRAQISRIDAPPS